MDAKTDALITLLTKDGEQLYIAYSPKYCKMIKEVRVGGNLEARNLLRNCEQTRYRQEIRKMIKWGWAIASTSERDLF